MTRSHWAGLVLAGLLLVGCGDGSSESSAEKAARTDSAALTLPSTTAPPETAPTTAAPTTVPTTTAAPTTAPTTTVVPATAPPPAPPPPPAPASLMPAVVCMNLQEAQDAIQRTGVFFSQSFDATGQGRMQLVDSNWVVVSQDPPPGTPITEGQANLGAVKYGEPGTC